MVPLTGCPFFLGKFNARALQKNDLLGRLWKGGKRRGMKFIRWFLTDFRTHRKSPHFSTCEKVGLSFLVSAELHHFVKKNICSSN